MPDVIITSDRMMMSDHRGKPLLGFIPTLPPVILPAFMWKIIACPAPKRTKNGEALYAPYGMRKIEAALLDAGIDAAVVPPKSLKKYINTAKVILLSHHDYLGLSPPTLTWRLFGKKTPMSVTSFVKFMNSRVIKSARKRGIHIIAGGPGAWQLALKPHIARALGIECIVEGEGEKIIPSLVEKAINGEKLPFHVIVDEIPRAEEIPRIKKPANNGLVEISRGNIRGCNGNMRHIPLHAIKRELIINKNAGLSETLLQSQDVPLYGSSTCVPNPTTFKKLHTMVVSMGNEVSWTQAEIASLYLAEKKYHLLSWMRDLIADKQDIWGAQVPIVTGSPKLAKKIIPERIAPLPSEKWNEIVEETFAIMDENGMVPIATLIIGLPEESPSDLVKTLELLDKLKKYKSTIIPFVFIPPEKLKGKYWYSRVDMTDLHKEVLIKTFYHTLHWGERLVKGYLRTPMMAPLRFLLRIIAAYVKVKALITVRKFIMKGEI